MNRITLMLLLIAAVALIVGWTRLDPAPAAQKWEYKSLAVQNSGGTITWREDGKDAQVPSVNERLKVLGEDGWEMSGYAMREGATAYWFKRPK